ncbi:hypothetical protein [Polaribacter atrinae]|nr:hypothetical protein [Polaribacter atrinae]
MMELNVFLLNEFTTQIMSHMGSFEVELQVHAADIDRVKEILAEVNQIE